MSETVSHGTCVQFHRLHEQGTDCVETAPTSRGVALQLEPTRIWFAWDAVLNYVPQILVWLPAEFDAV